MVAGARYRRPSETASSTSTFHILKHEYADLTTKRLRDMLPLNSLPAHNGRPHFRTDDPAPIEYKQPSSIYFLRPCRCGATRRVYHRRNYAIVPDAHAAARSMGTSVPRWNSQSAIRQTVSASRSTRSTAWCLSAPLTRALARPCSTSRLRAGIKPTSSALTHPNHELAVAGVRGDQDDP